jgi:hypothetical protein
VNEDRAGDGEAPTEGAHLDPIVELLSVLDRNLGFLNSDLVHLRRQLAAAGLARCRALLEGMLLLRDKARDDIVGVLFRSLVEAWMVSLYVLHKGTGPEDEGVLFELAADYQHWAAKMANATKGWAEGDAAEPILAAWRENVAQRKAEAEAAGKEWRMPGALNYADIARALGPLLERAGRPAGKVTDLYDRPYRGESIYNVHAGYGVLSRYLSGAPDADEHGVLARPPAPFPGEVKIGALLTADLAVRVFAAFGLTVKPPLDQVYERIRVFEHST